MVQDAEKYKNDDEQQRDRIQAKNALESYAYNMKSTAEDDKLKEKLSEEDRKKITDKCNEVISWLDHNQVRLDSEEILCSLITAVLAKYAQICLQ